MKKSYPSYYTDRSKFSRGQRRAFRTHAVQAIKQARTKNKQVLQTGGDLFLTAKPIQKAWRQW